MRARDFSPRISAILALIRVGLENRVPENLRWTRIHVAAGGPDSTAFSAHGLSRPNGCCAGFRLEGLAAAGKRIGDIESLIGVVCEPSDDEAVGGDFHAGSYELCCIGARATIRRAVGARARTLPPSGRAPIAVAA